MADFIWLFALKVGADEHKVADLVVGDPLELVCLKAGLVLVPRLPVLTALLADIFNVVKNELLSEGVRVFGLPEVLDLRRLKHISFCG